MPASPLHAGLDPRHGFLPPRLFVSRLTGASPGAWHSIPPLPRFTDLAGEAVPPRALRVQLAHDGAALLLRATVRERAPVRRTDAPPDGPDFWRQDHIELRFAPDPEADLDQTQIILACDGRLFDNRGWWRAPGGGGLQAGAARTAAGWRAWISIPFATLCGGPPAAPLHGLVAHCRWGDGVPDIACVTPAVLGFGHAERFAEFFFDDAPRPVILDGVGLPEGALRTDGQRMSVALRSAGGRPLAGRFRLQSEDGCAGTERTVVRETVLRPGRATRLTLPLTLHRPRYTRLRLWWETPVAGAVELGALTLRAAPAPLRRSRRPGPHPYLFRDAAGVARLRDKAAVPPFAPLTAEWRRPLPALPPLPRANDPRAFDFTPGCMNWFRVARESMLRDGAQGRRPASAHIWRLLPPEAQEAFRDVVRTVATSDGQLKVLITAMNGLLRRRDLYDATAFAAVKLPPLARAALACGIPHLDRRDLAGLNRALLQAAIECLHPFEVHRVAEAADCAGPWLLSGDVRWAAHASRLLEIADRRMILPAETHLHEGMAGARLALAYDLFAPSLTRTQRAVWVRVMARFLDLYLDTVRASAWTVTTIANANPVGNCGSGLLALALLGERPTLAREALGHARRLVWTWLDYCSGADGGNTEGAQYWQYGLENFIPFALALERALGHDDGLLSHPAVCRAMAMVRAGLGNDGALHGVNDTVPMPVGAPVAWFCAARFGDAAAQWYGDHAMRWLAARRVAGKAAVYGCDAWRALLLRTEAPEAHRAPPLPTAVLLRDIQVATLRSEPRWNASWVAGLKGSRPPYTHHNQADTGSFWLDVRGERLLIDPGYYKPGARDHSLPTVGGIAPGVPTAFVGEITACADLGDWRYARCDSSAAYGVAGWHVVRHLLLGAAGTLVVVDDIEATLAGKPAEVVGAFQCGAPVVAAAADSVRIHGRRSALALTWSAPGRAIVTRHPERTLHDTHWGYHFADCRWFPVTLSYRARGPLVTVVTEPRRRAPLRCRVTRAAGTLRVAADGSPPLRFQRHADGWRLAREGEDQ